MAEVIRPHRRADTWSASLSQTFCALTVGAQIPAISALPLQVPLTSNPSCNVQLHCPRPTDIDRPLNEAAADKIRDYRADYNNRPSNAISSMPAVVALLAASTVSLCAFYLCRLIGNRFFDASGVQLAQSNQFHYRRFKVLAFSLSYTDIPISVFPLPLALSLMIKTNPSGVVMLGFVSILQKSGRKP